MSRKLVFVGVFLGVLPVVMVAVKARAADPPQKGAVDQSNPFVNAAAAKPDEAKPQVDLAKPKPQSSPGLQGGEKAILKALKEKTALDFVQLPLTDVADFLSEKHHIPIKLDTSALKDANVDSSTSVTCRLAGISLRSALEIILDDLQLKWTIHHDVLMITTPQKAESDECMYTKAYDVADLLVTPMDYEAQNPVWPIKEVLWDHQTNTGITGGMWSCTGRPEPGNRPAPPALHGLNAIKDLVINIVATKTWQENGGTGTISEFDRMLVVSQTREVHLQIEQSLAVLRARRRAAPTLSVELHWLWLDAKQRDRLLPGNATPSDGQVSSTIDPQRLRQIAAEVPGFHGQAACLNGIGTAIAAGDRRAIMASTIPVVGGDCVGYSPVINVPNVGVTAQVRPTFVPGTKTAMLDITSIITRWGPARPPAIIGAAWPANRQVVASSPPPASLPAQDTAKPAPATTPPPAAPIVTTRSVHAGSASCPIDQPVMPTQQIGSTLRVPLGRPVIVGSMTFAPAEDAGLGAARGNPVDVYLVATTSIVKSASK
ncbi:MAG: hypothetical protein ABSH20_30620 [Tepidisphaeraceae bacterium]